MTPLSLLPECIVREDGQGAEVALDAKQAKRLLLTLRVNRILERETLEVSIQGSRDRKTWHPLAAFPKKSYCGTYSLPMDLTNNPDVRHLRVHWKMNRWNQQNAKPVFGFDVHAEELRSKVAGAA
ncbi:MAG TPA: hypothetical protein VLM42_11860 [Bryobacteraceae bacterium]|nr:hypothetical protein [Bryobacteraceae bacterium]